jgi:acetyl-CoA acetyltransferase
MREAVIVSTARTPLTKSHRGEFNITPGPTLAAFAVKAAVERSGLDPALIEDLIMGTGYPEGTTGRNIGRQAALRAGLPLSVAGLTVSRFCASGLQAIASAAGAIVAGAPAMVAGGVESISQIRTRSATDAGDSGMDPWLVERMPALYMAMIETADIVAARYHISREAQDRFSAESQRRTEVAQKTGIYADEIVPCTTTMAVTDKETKAVTHREVTATMDNCNRAGTTYEGLAKLAPVRAPDQFVTAGNASQLSDEAAGCLPWLRRGRLRARRDGHRPGLRHSQAAQAPWPHGRRHRPVGTQRSLRLASPVLPAAARHSAREAQRERRRHLHRPPLRHDGRAPGRPRAVGRPPPQGQVRGGVDVHRGRHGRRRPVRNLLIGAPSWT